MNHGRLFLRLLPAAALLLVVLAGWQLRLSAGEKEPAEKKGGTLTGIVTGKDLNGKPPYIEIKADGEAKGRKYSPIYKKGGLVNKTLEDIKTIPLGSRVRLEWSFDERARIVNLEVLKRADPEKK